MVLFSTTKKEKKNIWKIEHTQKKGNRDHMRKEQNQRFGILTDILAYPIIFINIVISILVNCPSQRFPLQSMSIKSNENTCHLRIGWIIPKLWRYQYTQMLAYIVLLYYLSFTCICLKICTYFADSPCNCFQ